MTDPSGLSIGTTNLVVARVGAPPATRRAVLTLYPHRAPEVGLPSENPNLNEPGQVIRGFVERVGDPVPLVAPDGSSHDADRLLIEAMAGMIGAPTSDLVIAVPAHWPSGTVRAFGAALRTHPVLSPNGVAPRLIPDATTALTALQTNPGLAGNGIVALLDFGASGTSITLADAEGGFQPIGETLRYPEFSGDQIDQALLTTVLAGISSSGQADPSATAAVGSLVRLREECRRAKERLSAETVTTLAVELPGSQSEIRLTRAELESVIAEPVRGVLAALEEQLDRHRLVWSHISAVATVGGGASIPYVTQQLSELSRAAVVTTPRPDLDAAIGAALTAARPDAEAPTGIGTAIGDAATAGLLGAGLGAAAPDPSQSSTFRALAWSQDDDVSAEPVPYTGPNPYAIEESGARPQIEYTPSTGEIDAGPRPWYRVPQFAIGGAALIALVAFGGVAYTLTTQSSSTEPSPSPSITIPVISDTVEPPPPQPPEPPPPPPVVTITQEPPPPRRWRRRRRRRPRRPRRSPRPPRPHRRRRPPPRPRPQPPPRRRRPRRRRRQPPRPRCRRRPPRRRPR